MMTPDTSTKKLLVTRGAVVTPCVRVTGLKADYLDRPLGLENPHPRLSWRLESSERNVRQSAYRVLVASSEEILKAGQGDLWDSGKINSAKSFGIQYQGRALTSRQRCLWQVQIWVESETASALSDMSWWEMGLLEPKDWSAQWLAVEDATIKADREAGLHWFWGEPTRGKSTRRFRYKLRLPAASQGGECYATTNDWSACAQVSRVWIDGISFGGPGAWVDVDAGVGDAFVESSKVRFALPELSSGDHLIAVEANTAALSPLVEGAFEHGLALFVRLNLKDGSTMRMGSDLSCKTSLVQDSDWYMPEYDDTAWKEARRAAVSHQPWPAQPAMHMRREFLLQQPVVKARLYATALGAYEARLNGERVGDALLAPEISQYAERVLYRVYDVTAMLRPGMNALGLIVGDGWYGSFDDRYAWGLPPRRILAQLELTLASGEGQIVATGPGWRIAESPIRESQVRIGEIYDARLEQPGWDAVGFDDTRWLPAEVADRPPCRLVAQVSPPIRATQVLKPREISQPKVGVYLFDFGQQFAGWCRLHVRGARGTRVELRFAELLTAAGEVDETYASIGSPKKDIFTLRGDAVIETFEPHFTYRGFRYVQVDGLPAPPTVESLEGIVVHSDLEVTGNLRIGAPLIEEIWRTIVWTRWSNFVGIPTDTPGREQRGYLATAGVCWDDAAFNVDVCAFTSRVMDNIVDDQGPDGAFPITAPEPRSGNIMFHVPGSPPAWGDGGIIIPWIAWHRYGDLGVIERNWEPMNRHLQFILDHNPDYVWKNKRSLDFGDWLSLDRLKGPNTLPTTPNDLIGTAYWAHCAALLGQMAEAIGRTGDADRLRTISSRVRKAFNAAFVKPDGTVGEGSQTGYVLALQFELLPEGVKQAAAERLAAEVRRHGASLTTGILGTQFILDVLTNEGFADLAYSLLLRTEYPSWGYMIRNGATAIWETWSGDKIKDGRSFNTGVNHSDLATISGFLFRRIAGIDAATPGFETIVVRPVLDPRVKTGGGDYDSIMGRISTDWAQTSDGGFTLDVTIPANASARIHLPAQRNSQIKEGGQEISRRNDMRIIDRLDHEVLIEVGSGSYRFVVARTADSRMPLHG